MFRLGYDETDENCFRMSDRVREIFDEHSGTEQPTSPDNRLVPEASEVCLVDPST